MHLWIENPRDSPCGARFFDHHKRLHSVSKAMVLNLVCGEDVLEEVVEVWPSPIGVGCHDGLVKAHEVEGWRLGVFAPWLKLAIAPTQSKLE